LHAPFILQNKKKHNSINRRTKKYQKTNKVSFLNTVYSRGTLRQLLPLQLPDNPVSSFHQIPIESGTPDRLELSEAECDIDTLKKLKLGMRSSLWSRPSGGGGGGGGGGLSMSNSGTNGNQPSLHPSDYSIAV
jgi:hypothetical protein